MAPSSKGINPAPDYTETMNRVQGQLEAQLRIVRSFMPQRSVAQQSTSSAAAKPSFSALASTSGPKPCSTTTPSRHQKQHTELLFAETRAQDPNAGLGFGGTSKRGSEREKERENQILRSRLLGRKRGAENASGRTARYEESSDEEPGRSGLGRAKKRARREVSDEEDRPPVSTSEAPESFGIAQLGDDGLEDGKEEEEENGGEDLDMRDGQGTAEDPAPNKSESTSEKKKRKKRKNKKKKNKLKAAEGE
ncbi:hypothetical protein F4803DRAFT_233947 [Xylaria telfairii]|nr:hypothetical protein F4803DRAFT_233947 [Xylaria telfairii]